MHLLFFTNTYVTCDFRIWLTLSTKSQVDVEAQETPFVKLFPSFSRKEFWIIFGNCSNKEPASFRVPTKKKITYLSKSRKLDDLLASWNPLKQLRYINLQLLPSWDSTWIFSTSFVTLDRSTRCILKLI